ncbi:hypothetical protein [Pseudodesulfovibrio sp.]|uniref:hypothetical protein n=1 Tax=unclassified Pseudodesulfovibrio TaxID=2661612 RepID=UPI003B001CE6
MKIGWFVPSTETDYDKVTSSVWMRCLQLIPYLTRLGVENVINDYDCDVAMFVRWQDETALAAAKRLRQAGTPVIFDMVVNYFEESHSSYRLNAVSSGQVTECRSMVEQADMVTCVSEYIAGKAKQYHDTVRYLPDSIDFSHFNGCKDPADFDRPKLRALWCGVSVKANDLTPVLPLLKKHGLDLTIISDARVKLGKRHFFSRSYPYDFYRWSYNRPEHLLQGEIALGYRDLTHVYDRGHSFFKVGLPLSQGLPVLASPVPSYSEIIHDNKGGKLCTTLEEWDDILGRIVADRSLLKTWSSQAQAIMEPYSTENLALRYLECFRILTGEAKG